MGNHLHLLVKTPRPYLGAGMQSFLSGYAIWAGRRWRRLGHLFQGRYRAEMIEDCTIRRHRRFARPSAAGSWAPGNSWLACGPMPVPSCPILRSPKRDSSRIWTRNGSSRL